MVTVLIAAKPVACTKRYARLGTTITKTDYPDDLYNFTAHEIAAANLDDLARIVTAMSRLDNAMIVRGGLTPHACAELVAGRLIQRNKSIAPAHLEELALPWAMLDLDDCPLRPTDDLASDPVAVIEHAILTYLPTVFHDVTVFWQLSASCGFTPGLLKVHLWYWLGAPMDNLLLRQLLVPHVDIAPFNAVQPHYIVPPVCVGLADPLPRRMGWLLGANDVAEVAALPMPETSFMIPSLGGRGSGNPAADLMATLATLGDGANRFHAPLRDACSLYGRAVGERFLARNDDEFKNLLRTRIDAAPKYAGRDVRRYLSDAYLDGLISSAVVKQQRAWAAHPFMQMLHKTRAA